jgi:hypothetical protein
MAAAALLLGVLRLAGYDRRARRGVKEGQGR